MLFLLDNEKEKLWYLWYKQSYPVKVFLTTTTTTIAKTIATTMQTMTSITAK